MPDDEEDVKEGSVAASIKESMSDLEMTDDDIFEPSEEITITPSKDEPEDDEGSEKPDEPVSDQKASEQPEQDLDPIPAPRSWSAEHREWFNSQPRKAQEAFIKRQADMDRDYHQRRQETESRGQSLRDIDEKIAPYRAELAKDGLSPGELFTQFYSWHKYIQANPAQGIKELAKRYGVNPQQLTTEEVASNSNPEVEGLRTKLTELEQFIESQKQTQQQQYVQSVQQQVENFRQEKDESGKLRYPYIENGGALENDMAEALKILRAQNPSQPIRDLLSRAYQHALALNPDIQALRSAPKPAPKQDREKVEKAKLAGSSINGSPEGSSPPPSAGSRSIREELLANFRQLSN